MSTQPVNDGAATTKLGPSFVDPAAPEPWSSYLEQIDRVTPHLGGLAGWVETLRRPNER